MRRADHHHRLSDSLIEDVAPRWEVEVVGYRWVGGRRERALTGVSDAARPELRHYPLSDVPGLFRTFAALEPTEDALVGFANEYGLLGLGGNDKVTVPGPH